MTLVKISDRLAPAIAALDEAAILPSSETRWCIARVSDDLLALRLEIERDMIRAWRAVEA